MLINPYVFGGYDINAQSYITAVETADGQALETGVKNAINAFVVGCKTDGIWNAIKASCILAGARTLAGALVPLAGAAPTNVNFVSGDYNRKTGLVGNASNKYINSNRNNNADPQNSCHISVYVTSVGLTTSTPKFMIGRLVGGANEKALVVVSTLNAGSLSARCQSTTWASHGQVRVPGLIGAQRNNSTTVSIRNNQSTVNISQGSTLPSSGNNLIFASTDSAENPVQHDDSRLAFYSIGESIDLAKLDSRITTLINALAAAIP